MSQNFHEQLDDGELPLPSDRSTGLVFAGVAAIIAILWRENTWVLATASVVCLLFVGVSLLKPIVLRPLNVVWFKFGLLLNKIVSPLVMFVLFVVTIVPFGLALQLRADPMRRRRTGSEKSYWIISEKDVVKSTMKNQF